MKASLLFITIVRWHIDTILKNFLDCCFVHWSKAVFIMPISESGSINSIHICWKFGFYFLLDCRLLVYILNVRGGIDACPRKCMTIVLSVRKKSEWDNSMIYLFFLWVWGLILASSKPVSKSNCYSDWSNGIGLEN